MDPASVRLVTAQLPAVPPAVGPPVPSLAVCPASASLPAADQLAINPLLTRDTFPRPYANVTIFQEVAP